MEGGIKAGSKGGRERRERECIAYYINRACIQCILILLTVHEVCTVNYQTEVFLVDRATYMNNANY